MKKQAQLPVPLYLYKFALQEFSDKGIIDFSKTTLLAPDDYKYYKEYFDKSKELPRLTIIAKNPSPRRLYAIKIHLEEVFHINFIVYTKYQLATGALLKEAIANFLQQYNICEFTELKHDTLSKRWTRHQQELKSRMLLAA